QVDPPHPIVLALGQGWSNPVLELLDRKTSENQNWLLGSEVAFCRVNRLPVGAHDIFVKEETVGDFERLEFAVDQLGLPAVAGVVLTTEQLGGGPPQRIDLLDEGAAQRWTALLTGRERLCSIQLPDGWRVTLRWQGQDGTNHGPDSLGQEGALAALI